MDRSYNLNIKTRLLSKNTYLETHHFPNLNPVKRSVAEPSPTLDRCEPLKYTSLKEMKLSQDSTSLFLKVEAPKFEFSAVQPEIKNFTFESEDPIRKQDQCLKILEEENRRLKEGFLEKERAYIKEIENVSSEILEIKEKYRKFEGNIEQMLEEKNSTIEKLRNELRQINKKPEENVTSFRTFQKDNRLKELLDISEQENKNLKCSNEQLEVNFLLLSIENDRLQEETKSSKSWKQKYEDLEASHQKELEEFKRSLINLKEKKIELEVEERVAEATHQKSQEIHRLRLELRETMDRYEAMQKEMVRIKNGLVRGSKENMVLREINL